MSDFMLAISNHKLLLPETMAQLYLKTTIITFMDTKLDFIQLNWLKVYNTGRRARVGNSRVGFFEHRPVGSI